MSVGGAFRPHHPSPFAQQPALPLVPTPVPCASPCATRGHSCSTQGRQGAEAGALALAPAFPRRQGRESRAALGLPEEQTAGSIASHKNPAAAHFAGARLEGLLLGKRADGAAMPPSPALAPPNPACVPPEGPAWVRTLAQVRGRVGAGGRLAPLLWEVHRGSLALFERPGAIATLEGTAQERLLQAPVLVPQVQLEQRLQGGHHALWGTPTPLGS